VNKGARVPPDVPLPSEIDQDTNLSTPRTSNACPPKSPERMRSMLSYPTPSVCGEK